MAFSLKNLTTLVNVAIENGASDIHIRSNETPSLRIRGELIPIQTKLFKLDDLFSIAKVVTGEEIEDIKDIKDINELDGSFSVENVCRLRYNFFIFGENLGVIFRLVKIVVPSIDELHLPSVIKKIAEQQRGLVLVSGATGSGKSTTLAAIIDHINKSRSAHIITIEDPIEFVHTQKKCKITQREIGTDTEDFHSALRSAMRQDPDVILIGEMRDPETISIALKAAETGHIVFSSIHTTNAVATIGRIISMFPANEQVEVRKRLSENLFATVGQRMLKGKKPKSVYIAQEIMLTGPGIKECILGQEDISRINTIIASGKGKRNSGPQTFDQHIFELYEKGLISKSVALEAATSESDFNQKLIVD